METKLLALRTTEEPRMSKSAVKGLCRDVAAVRITLENQVVFNFE